VPRTPSIGPPVPPLRTPLRSGGGEKLRRCTLSLPGGLGAVGVLRPVTDAGYTGLAMAEHYEVAKAGARVPAAGDWASAWSRLRGADAGGDDLLGSAGRAIRYFEVRIWGRLRHRALPDGVYLRRIVDALSSQLHPGHGTGRSVAALSPGFLTGLALGGLALCCQGARGDQSFGGCS
jgi:hypothetical protein